MKNHSMTLTIPRASQEDQGIYTLQMFVNNERLNTTSCTLNVQERAGTYLIPLNSHHSEMEYLDNHCHEQHNKLNAQPSVYLSIRLSVSPFPITYTYTCTM